jgi:hypothetical protein
MAEIWACEKRGVHCECMVKVSGTFAYNGRIGVDVLDWLGKWLIMDDLAPNNVLVPWKSWQRGGPEEKGPHSNRRTGLRDRLTIELAVCSLKSAAVAFDCSARIG